ncbi:hypothetical protein EUTSA_v10009139mg [Eutrema salsugineum]|uniref:Uncharacterized protein n=1 Tax=Eutrema salsugineum TaxID=72664 RepID=V4KXT0_EUTSA|nr:hypothetical protein EUTSA_v10009139mg [Eutrema salsugineum]
MGSLMSGWDSPPADPNSVKRCKSLTREDIDAFWKEKKKNEEEHVQAISKLVVQVAESQAQEEKIEDDPYENQSKKSGWWQRSTWAFLNEPREEEGRPNKYVSQFKVAHIAKSVGQ